LSKWTPIGIIVGILLTPSSIRPDDPVSPPPPPSGKASGLGDLSTDEVDRIQDIVEQAERPLDVVGSAARGERGPGSDIDYTTAGANWDYFKDLGQQLPGIDPDHGVLRGPADPYEGPSIRFEPGASPQFNPGK
jgi:hypothetical protein